MNSDLSRFSHIRRLSGLTTAASLFFAMLPPVEAQEIAVWSARAKAWAEWLQKECAQESALLSVAGNAVPVEQFSSYKMVIIGQGSPERWTPEQHEAVRRYMEGGGIVLILSLIHI